MLQVVRQSSRDCSKVLRCACSKKDSSCGGAYGNWPVLLSVGGVLTAHHVKTVGFKPYA